MKKTLLLIWVGLMMIQCAKKKDSDSQLDEFQSEESVTFQTIDYPEILGVTMQIMKKDSLIILNDFHGDSLINLFNIKDNHVTKLIPVGNGPDELTRPLDIQMVNNKLYVYGRNSFSMNLLNLDLLSCESEKVNFLFHAPTNCSRFLNLSDSVFICSGFWKKRYALINNKGEVINEFGDYPDFEESEKKFDPHTKAMFHQSQFAKHPHKKLFASCARYVLEVFDYSETEIPRLVLRKKLGKYNYTHQEGDLLNIDLSGDSDPGVFEIACSSKYLFLVTVPDLEGKTDILVLDWEGNPIKKLKSDKTITCLTIDENNNKVYGVITDPEDTLVSFDINL